MLIDLRLAEKTPLRQIPSSTKLRLGSIFLFISGLNDRGNNCIFCAKEFAKRRRAMLAAFQLGALQKGTTGFFKKKIMSVPSLWHVL